MFRLPLEILDPFRERILSQVPSDERIAELLAEMDKHNKARESEHSSAAAPKETAS